MDAATNHLSLFRIAALVLALLSTVIQAGDESSREPAATPAGHADRAATGRRHPRLPVLGYVTPWNGGGRQMVEQYRERFDMVCPVWYTVHPSDDPTEVYSVRGGPPGDEDRDWYRTLQQPTPHAATSEPLKSLQVLPRFILDNWNQDDYRGLLFNQTRWAALSKAVMSVVEDMSFDGVVFESGATHALAGPLSALSDALHGSEKKLVLVSPPIRASGDGDGAGGPDPHSSMILKSLPSLTALADYITIMTYDMHGPGGQECKAPFPASSPAGLAQKQGNVREPGPNTSAEWVRLNLEAFVGNSEGTEAELEDQQVLYRAAGSTKFLMGLPLYGYTYPIMYIDVKKGSGERTKRDKTSKVAGILRGAGKPITVLEIQRLMEADTTYELEETEDGEFFFDYAEDDGSWRVFLPTEKSMSKVLDVIEDTSTLSGVALWEVGQTSGELLSTL